MSRHDPEYDEQASPYYALGRIAKALATGAATDDPETRDRADRKVETWITIFERMLSNTLRVGSRTPVPDAPAWVTLEVATGGFATGRFMAGGPLRPHEQERLRALPEVSDEQARAALNAACLTDAGLAQLQEQLRSGCYEIDVPEEGALLVVAWLVERGLVAEAQALLDRLATYFSQLRFYPQPSEAPKRSGPLVYLQDVADTLAQVRRTPRNQLVLAQREAVTVWTPIYDRLVSLFLETVEGEPPTLVRKPASEATPSATHDVIGGCPCRAFPPGWQARAQALLAEMQTLRAQHPLCGKFDDPKGHFARLRKYLALYAADARPQREGDAQAVRFILAGYVTKRGLPGSATCRARREPHLAHASAPTFQELAVVVAERLSAYPARSGLSDPAETTHPLTDDEAARFQLPAGAAIPDSVQRKVERCLMDTVDALVEREIITSGETLARVLPQLTSGLRAASIEDETLRTLYAAIYRAFRRRRSLLLLNLDSQVRLEELPWVQAIEAFRRESLSSAQLAEQTLKEIVTLTLLAFPQAILPNKLIQELAALAKTAGMQIPLVEELAADIFMGQFGRKFLSAAHTAGELLGESLYARYYAIDYDSIFHALIDSGTDDAPARGRGDFLAQYCSARAGVQLGGWDAAANGMILEQQQIVTTQNLAALFVHLDLETTLRGQLDDLARRTFEWLCRRQQIATDRWHARLIAVKNSAYAWRQMVFYLSLAPASDVESFLNWADEQLTLQSPVFRKRFAPALVGLRWAFEGETLTARALKGSDARVFLGWSRERHWLLAE